MADANTSALNKTMVIIVSFFLAVYLGGAVFAYVQNKKSTADVLPKATITTEQSAPIQTPQPAQTPASVVDQTVSSPAKKVQDNPAKIQNQDKEDDD
ncbi:hypothetical protein EB118_01360 [bacterium]|nr:hypothetical protein [bacterium]NBX97893.1 hypothetical protein [bacterium]NDC93867.1 hypothetical protein [bacterium]NDD82814.1 hypothetical protein [bacterium]NDG28737.1 hypothetical protein [bacterium]